LNSLAAVTSFELDGQK